MQFKELGNGETRGDKGEKPQCPMPNAPCPMPHAQFLISNRFLE
ncbi:MULTISPECIES: hypothetical protein [Nostocales]|nr:MULTISPECIES: hypothetical protein [Nostocales]